MVVLHFSTSDLVRGILICLLRNVDVEYSAMSRRVFLIMPS